MTNMINILLLALAFCCFLISGVGWAVGKVNLIGIGLALFMLYMIFNFPNL